jgi:hypothetical protein
MRTHIEVYLPVELEEHVAIGSHHVVVEELYAAFIDVAAHT